MALSTCTTIESFPELFSQKSIKQTEAANSPPLALFGMERPSKELLVSFKKYYRLFVVSSGPHLQR